MFAPRISNISGQVARTGLGSTSRLARTASASPRFLEPFASYSSSTTWSVSGPSSPLLSYANSTRLPNKRLSIGYLERYSTKSAGSKSILGQITAFSTSTRQALRESYFRRPNGRSNSSGGGSGRGSGPGWFENLRRRIDRLPPMYVIYGIIGANVGIFLVWQYAQASWTRFRDPTLYRWMSQNFIVSEANLAAGRLHTLLTCCFSHSNTGHIALNMLGLYFIGPATAGLLGPASFLGLYLGGGIVSSMVSLAWHRMMSSNRSKSHGSEGASGAIYASLAYYAAMFPQAQFLLFFVVPLPAWAAVGGIFAYDLYSSIRSPMAVTDSAGHVGGLLAGVAYAFRSRGRGGPRMRGRW
ncbi:hypothetical protein FFLO_05835 [Filobasidium floriforme]|uniref:Peptidase S54 rhomboid domain-containing protein n=1 Tax=Filobasidium floriforme TaxID=5210 RepID=A0A8K0JHW0_9TREE|nr:hypothetical protein FFLO_05835 [Filobasidium floriforme]